MNDLNSVYLTKLSAGQLDTDVAGREPKYKYNTSNNANQDNFQLDYDRRTRYKDILVVLKWNLR